MTKTYRPGVYSQYDIISQRRSLQDRYAFYCGAAKVREGKSIPAGGVVQIHSRQELEEYFDTQGGALFCAVCGILLDSGVSGRLRGAADHRRHRGGGKPVRTGHPKAV